MKSVLITGGSGAFGSAFAKRLLDDDQVKRIIIYSRGEYRQFQLMQELAPFNPNDKLRFFIGDVRDRDRLQRAMHEVEVVVHAAALKRIEVGHYNPMEMVKTNVMGAMNVIEAAQSAGVKRVVALSTDKAFEPVSPYGHSKAMAESMFLAANNTMGWSGPRFSVCRYGNVWGSTGSVVPIWQKLIQEGKEITITDPECTRFFMRMREAVDLVLHTIELGSREIVIPTLPAYTIGDLADALGATQRKIVGLPEWEKKHESMSKGNSSDLARRMTIEELKKAFVEEA